MEGVDDVMQREQFIVELCVAILLGILAILVSVRYHFRRLRDQVASLPSAPEGTEKILEAIEGSRQQMDVMHDQHQQERLMAARQLTEHRAQVRWLIERYDQLARWFKEKFG